MADVKAQELSLDQWSELLEPYGWADATTRSLTRLSDGAHSSWYDIRVMLRPAAPDGDRDEWVRRSGLLDQARRAVEAVQAKGYMFMDAPRIEFAGEYRYRVDTGRVPEWTAAAELSFRVHAT